MNKLVILDFFLEQNRGHNEQYDFSLASEAVRQGIPTEIWCPGRGDNHQPGFVKQCLTSKPLTKKNLCSKALSALARTLELRKIFAQNNFDRDTVILIPSIDSHLLLDLSLALLGRQVKPKIIIVVRRGLKDHIQTLGPLIARLRTLLTDLFLKYLHDKKNILFLSDSELITDEIVSFGFADAKTLPIPHLPPRQEPPRCRDGTVIGYFGDARYDKGFDLLPAIIESVFKKYQSVSFILQSFLFDSSGPVQVAAAKLCALRDAFPDRITLLPKYLSDAEYTDYMRKCSIVLIPYRKQFYGKGTSGILAEAIACGAWAVVPAGTWMAAQKSRYSKIVVFDSLDVGTVAEAVGYCIENEKNIDVKLLNYQIHQWYQFHCPARYIDIMLSVTADLPKRHQFAFAGEK